jgi:hypothetical protein
MILNSILGVLTGLGGSLLSNLFNLRSDRDKYAHELKLGELRLKEMEMERSYNISEVKISGDIQDNLRQLDAMIESQKTIDMRLIDSSAIQQLLRMEGYKWLGALLTFLLAIVDVLRFSIRPVMTIVLLAVVIWLIEINWSTIIKQGHDLPLENILVLIDGVCYLSFTAVGWWFADRSVLKHVTKRNRS